jgi:hypothetical protein
VRRWDNSRCHCWVPMSPPAPSWMCPFSRTILNFWCRVRFWWVRIVDVNGVGSASESTCIPSLPCSPYGWLRRRLSPSRIRCHATQTLRLGTQLHRRCRPDDETPCNPNIASSSAWRRRGEAVDRCLPCPSQGNCTSKVSHFRSPMVGLRKTIRISLSRAVKVAQLQDLKRSCRGQLNEY